MTVLIAIIIASILCGVLLSAMWASANSLSAFPQDVKVKICLEPDGKADGLGLAVVTVTEQFERLNAEPEIFVSTGRLEGAELEKARKIAETYKITTVES